MADAGKKSKPPFPARLNDFLIIVSARVRFLAEQRLRFFAVELALRRPNDVRDLLRRLRREVQPKRLDPADGLHLIQ